MTANASQKTVVAEEQYSLAKILGLWVAAAAPMGILAYVVFPALGPDFESDPIGSGFTRTALIAVGLSTVEHGDYEILNAVDGEAGIALVQNERPDLIVLDLMMPGVDGFAVLDALKADESLRDVPVIVVTAKDLTPQEQQRLSNQVESLLHKGSFIDEGALQDIIEKLS